MFYLGLPPPSSSFFDVEPCFVDPRLSVAKNRSPKNDPPTYYPSYSKITPSQRRGFLQWMANGRSDPEENLSLVFVFFYGLEYRVFKEGVTADAPRLIAEAERLLAIYGNNRSFSYYAGKFIAFASPYVTDANQPALDLQITPNEMPLNCPNLPRAQARRRRRNLGGRRARLGDFLSRRLAQALAQRPEGCLRRPLAKSLCVALSLRTANSNSKAEDPRGLPVEFEKLRGRGQGGVRKPSRPLCRHRNIRSAEDPGRRMLGRRRFLHRRRGSTSRRAIPAYGGPTAARGCLDQAERAPAEDPRELSWGSGDRYAHSAGYRHLQLGRHVGQHRSQDAFGGLEAAVRRALDRGRRP